VLHAGIGLGARAGHDVGGCHAARAQDDLVQGGELQASA
jgi:hypothetical protein